MTLACHQHVNPLYPVLLALLVLAALGLIVAGWWIGSRIYERRHR